MAKSTKEELGFKSQLLHLLRTFSVPPFPPGRRGGGIIASISHGRGED